MSLSDDPEVRAVQEGNLLKGSESPGTAGPGNRLAERHGLRARLTPTETVFSRMVEDVPAIGEHFEAIIEAIPAPTRGKDGSVAPGDRLQAEALALSAYQVAHASDYFARHPDERLQSLALWSALTERYARGLERLGIGAAARARLGVDVMKGQSLAQQMAAAADRGDDDDEKENR